MFVWKYICILFHTDFDCLHYLCIIYDFYLNILNTFLWFTCLCTSTVVLSGHWTVSPLAVLKQIIFSSVYIVWFCYCKTWYMPLCELQYSRYFKSTSFYWSFFILFVHHRHHHLIHLNKLIDGRKIHFLYV